MHKRHLLIDYVCVREHILECTPYTPSFNAAVNGHLELTLLNDRQRFDAISTSNVEVYKFGDW